MRSTCTAVGCDQLARSLGLCPKHWYRLKTHGDPNVVTRIMGNDEERFLSKIRVAPTDCHLWLGSVNRYGYGEFRLRTTNKAAHRYAWERVNGPIEGDLTIDHLCHVRHCVNPDHMVLATVADNVRRARARARAESTHCGYGHEWTDENTYLYRGQRQCRACGKRRSAKRRRTANAGG
jgi:hypothetical protein